MRFVYANIAFLSIILSACFAAAAQESDSARVSHPHRFKAYRKTELLTGFNFQTSHFKDARETRKYGEIGIARSLHFNGPHGTSSLGVYLSEEIYLGDKNIYGTKLGMYTHYLFDVGIAAVYYTDFEKGNFKLRPELGVGMGAVRIVGGFNIPTFGNKAFAELSRSMGQLTVQAMWPVARTAIDRKKNVYKELFKF